MIPVDKSNRKSLHRFYQGYKWNYLPDAVLEGAWAKHWSTMRATPRLPCCRSPSSSFRSLAGCTPPAPRIHGEAAQVFGTHLRIRRVEELLQEVHAGKLVGMQRYAFTGEKLDIDHLRGLASQAPDGYRPERIDLSLAKRLAAERSEFASAHMRNFDCPRISSRAVLVLHSGWG